MRIHILPNPGLTCHPWLSPFVPGVQLMEVWARSGNVEGYRCYPWQPGCQGNQIKAIIKRLYTGSNNTAIQGDGDTPQALGFFIPRLSRAEDGFLSLRGKLVNLFCDIVYTCLMASSLVFLRIFSLLSRRSSLSLSAPQSQTLRSRRSTAEDNRRQGRSMLPGNSSSILRLLLLLVSEIGG